MSNGKAVKPLSKQDAHYLLPIDRQVTENHDKALLLLHGFASSPAVFRALLPQIKGYDRIVCPVLPGHSESMSAFAKTTAKNWQDCASEYCDQLVSTYQQVSIIGMSLGGLLAAELTHHFSLHHLYLLAPALKLPYSARLALWAAHLLQTLGWRSLHNYSGYFCNSNNQELGYRRLPLPAIIEILSLIRTQKIVYPTCPTDVFLGRFDKVIDSNAVAQSFASQPQTRVHWLNHSAHLLPLDGDIEQLVSVINRPSLV